MRPQSVEYGCKLGASVPLLLISVCMLCCFRVSEAYRELHLCNGSGRRYCANTQRAVRCPRTCRPENCVKRPSGEKGAFYTRCSQIRPPVCQNIYWEEIGATNMYDYVYLNTTMNQDEATVCMSTCREEPFRGICLASETGVNGIDYCKQIDCRRLTMPNHSGCHQPRDFHSPTCLECEILFPLACGSDEGGVLKGWKSLRDELIRKQKFQESLAYNATVVEYAKMVDSTFEDAFRWLNGASAPKLPHWYLCAKMNVHRVQFVQSLAQQKRGGRIGSQQPVLAGFHNDTPFGSPSFPAAGGTTCLGASCTGHGEESSDFLNNLASSEELPYAESWAAYGCKSSFPDVTKMYDSEYNQGESDSADEGYIPVRR